MPTLTNSVNLFLEKIMQESLHDHHKSISIGGRPLRNLQFTDINLKGSRMEHFKTVPTLVHHRQSEGVE